MSKRGFTLIELIAVVAIVGILAAVAIPKKESDANLAIPFQARKLATDIRRVQLEAMSTGQPLCLVASGTAYNIKKFNGACYADYPEPGTASGQWNVALTTGIEFKTSASLGFDSLGQPYEVTAPLTPKSADSSLTLETTTKKSYSIQVTPLTGWVKVISP